MCPRSQCPDANSICTVTSVPCKTVVDMRGMSSLLFHRPLFSNRWKAGFLCALVFSPQNPKLSDKVFSTGAIFTKAKVPGSIEKA